MRTRLIEHDNAQQFLAAIDDRITGREAELNLMLGLAERGVEGLYATVSDKTGPLAAVVRTPPFGFVVAELVSGSVLRLASRLFESGVHLDAPSVVGTKPVSRMFAERWVEQVGGSARLEMAQRILALTEVAEPRPSVLGSLCLASDGDVDLVLDWFRGFVDDALSEREKVLRDWDEKSRERVRRGEVFLWKTDGRAVSMACIVRAAGGGIGIGGVFTPREERGRGFASACVAVLSQRALDNGHRFCCLYTNAANPTSNRIYEHIGYRLVAESELWVFERTSTEG